MDMSRWTVTVETLDEDGAAVYGQPWAEGESAVVVRYHDGRLVKVAHVRSEVPPALSLEKVAEALATEYGAVYAGQR